MSDCQSSCQRHKSTTQSVKWSWTVFFFLIIYFSLSMTIWYIHNPCLCLVCTIEGRYLLEGQQHCINPLITLWYQTAEGETIPGLKNMNGTNKKTGALGFVRMPYVKSEYRKPSRKNPLPLNLQNLNNKIGLKIGSNLIFSIFTCPKIGQI